MMSRQGGQDVLKCEKCGREYRRGEKHKCSLLQVENSYHEPDRSVKAPEFDIVHQVKKDEAWARGLSGKAELIDRLAEATSLSKADAGRAIDALFNVDRGIIVGALKAGDKVQITGFGTFDARLRKQRMGRNPRTGDRIQIPASVSPAFRPGKGFKGAAGFGP